MPELSTFMYGYLTVVVFMFGACIGSFLNVCIYRIPRELSVVRPGSHCPACNRPIPWYLNIPLVSWIMLRGRCRFCGARIAVRYVLVELLVAVLFLLAWLKLGVAGEDRPLMLVGMTELALVPVYWLLIGGLVVGTFVDFEHLIIPDRISLGGIVAGLILSPLVPAMHGTDDWVVALFRAALGAGMGWAMLWGVGAIGTIIFRKPAMGFGDVKLIGAIGAFLGWQAVLFTIVLSSFFGSMVGISLVLAGKKAMQSRIPYGPYLALAALVWVLWGSCWWEWYLHLLSRPAMAIPM